MPVLGHFIDEAVKQYGNNIALVYGDRRKTFKEVNDRMNRYANALLKLGLMKGDRIALMQYNSDKWIEGLGGHAKIGTVTIPINLMLSAEEVIWVLNDTEAKVFLFRENLIDLVDKIKSQVHTVEHFICVSDDKLGKPDYMLDFEELIACSEAGSPPVRTEMEDMIFMPFTSGTTGKPKGAICCHDNFTQGLIINNLINYLRDMKTGDKFLVTTPLTNLAHAWVWPTFVQGGTTVILDKFDPEEYLDTIEREKINYSLLVSTTIIKLCEFPNSNDFDLSSLKLIGYAGSPVPKAVMNKAISTFGNVFMQMYGSSEILGLSTMLLPEDHLRKLGSCGRPVIGCEVKIVGEDGNELPPGEPGRLAISSPGMIKGYWKNPIATRQTLVGKWVISEDIALKDKEGFIYMLDRSNDMIISGGYNVYPAEVENCVYEHPSVSQAVVIGVPDPKWVEAVKAVVVLKSNQSITEQDLIQHCKERIANYKVPKSVDFVEELPINNSGKILRRKVREWYTSQGINY